jgi:DNA-binding NarL/FixJ family response regulator
MRKTSLLFVENDSALRGLLAGMLATSDQIELLGSFANASDLLDSGVANSADVALLDYSLDPEGLNGVELGIHLRNLNEHIGIVIYSQFSVAPMVRRVPISMLGGWSFLQKKATASLSEYLEAVQSTVKGRGNWSEIIDSTNGAIETDASMFFNLTPRQRSIMALASKSKSAQDIASVLNLSHPHVRKELSRAYKVLLPDAQESVDLKTAAVLKYIELMRAVQ